MEIRQPKRLESFDLAERLGLDKTTCSMEFDPQNNILSVTFDKHLVQVPQVMNAVMEVTEVQDIQIQETELAEIVKGIYRSTGSH